MPPIPKPLPFPTAKQQAPPTLVALPGGALSAILRSPEVDVFEVNWNAEPNEAWYDPARAPTNPTQFEIGTYQVPADRTLIVLDFCVEPHRFSEVGGHEWQPVADRSLRGSLAYLFQVAGKTPGVVEFYLDPKASIFEPEQFLVNKVSLWSQARFSNADFARARSVAYGTAAGYGTTLLPQRTTRYGAPDTPFGLVVRDQQTVVLRGVVYRAISTPLATVEASITGIIGPTVTLAKHIKSMEGVLP